MSSVGIEVKDAVQKVSGEEQPSERLPTDVKRKEDTGHECSFCSTCWTDE